MFEKVNPCHPDKVADRIAGAIVDLCYTKSRDPKVAPALPIGRERIPTSVQIVSNNDAQMNNKQPHTLTGAGALVARPPHSSLL